jgi:hypothetical protein
MGAPKKPRTPVVRINEWYRVTAWISAEALEKLELAVIELKRERGRKVEFGDVLDALLLERYSGLYLGDRRTAPAPPSLSVPELPAEPAAGAA